MTPQDDAPTALTLRDVLRLLLRGAPFALVVTLLAVATAVFVTDRLDSVYSAEVTLVVSQSVPRVTSVEIIAAPVVDPGVYRTAVYEGDVLRRALAAAAGGPVSPRDVERYARSVRITIEPQQLSSILRIDVRDSSPVWAADLANAIAQELVVWDYTRAQSRFMQAVAAIERSIASIDAELTDPQVSATEARQEALRALRADQLAALERTRAAGAVAVYVPLVEQLSAAAPPTDRVSPRPVLNVAIALLLGLMAGYGLFLIVAVSNPRVGNAEDLQRFSGLPVLAEFPRRGMPTRERSEEAIGWLHARLAKMKPRESCLVVAITGLRAPDDSGSVAVSLAEAFARTGERTLLIDADWRRGRTTQELGLDVAHTGRAAGDFEPPTAKVVVDNERSFDFLGAAMATGRPADRLGRFIDEQRATWPQRFDVVVLETSPLLPFADALVVATHAVGTVLCVQPGVASRSDIRRALALLNDVGVRVVGTVLTVGGRSQHSAAMAARARRDAAHAVGDRRRPSVARRSQG
jgi:Mrp family chromosome partitioning ATPase